MEAVGEQTTQSQISSVLNSFSNLPWNTAGPNEGFYQIPMRQHLTGLKRQELITGFGMERFVLPFHEYTVIAFEHAYLNRTQRFIELDIARQNFLSALTGGIFPGFEFGMGADNLDNSYTYIAGDQERPMPFIVRKRICPADSEPMLDDSSPREMFAGKIHKFISKLNEFGFNCGIQISGQQDTANNVIWGKNSNPFADPRFYYVDTLNSVLPNDWRRDDRAKWQGYCSIDPSDEETINELIVATSELLDTDAPEFYNVHEALENLIAAQEVIAYPIYSA